MATILIIDDDREIRLALERACEDAGHEVFTASNGLDGFRYFRERPCDLVITDLAMPEQDGLETIAGIRREFPTARIFAIADAASRMLLNLAVAFGAERTFVKPIVSKRIVDAVGNLTASA